ncbi:MAG: hypothetical protein OXR67_02985 [Chloroflexota bacterium]|nr:hypothetical protein [Chloroflexota bacterium]
MYTLSQIRRHVDSLKQKYATELTILRLRPLAEEFCLLWSEAIIDGNPPPDSYAFIRHIARQGFRLNTYTGLHLYLERCSENGRNPNTIGIVASLLPEVRPARLEELLLDDSSDEQESPTSVTGWIPAWIWNPHAVARLFAGLLDNSVGQDPYPEVLAPENLNDCGNPLSPTGPRRDTGRLSSATSFRLWGNSAVLATTGPSTLEQQRTDLGANGVGGQQLPCHRPPANAKLPPTPHPRDAIRHPLRC